MLKQIVADETQVPPANQFWMLVPPGRNCPLSDAVLSPTESFGAKVCPTKSIVPRSPLSHAVLPLSSAVLPLSHAVLRFVLRSPLSELSAPRLVPTQTMQIRCPLSHAIFCPVTYGSRSKHQPIISDVRGLVPMDGLVLLVVLGCCSLLGLISFLAIDWFLGCCVNPSVVLPGDGMVRRGGLDLFAPRLTTCEWVARGSQE